MNVQLTENHNWTEGSNGARGAVGARAISVHPSGSKLVVIGNFRKADGEVRRQAALINLTGGAATVAPDWRTDRYQDRCFDWAFDSYIRDVDFSPDGSYFVIVATGGPNPGTLCDTAARFATAESGQAIEPVWIDDTGGDTLWSVAATGAAVYTGGHQRWHNNAGGLDSPAPGAVPRAGVGAIDPRSGVPLSWNPGRNPRGVAAFVMQPTAAGLWLGQDTTYIGNFEYWRPRLAFFPLAGGVQYGPGSTGNVPSNVYLGATGAHRIDRRDGSPSSQHRWSSPRRDRRWTRLGCGRRRHELAAQQWQQRSRMGTGADGRRHGSCLDTISCLRLRTMGSRGQPRNELVACR